MLKIVMPGLMEEVADRNYSSSFPGEVHRKRGRGATEHSDDWIQLLAATLKIRTGHGEVGRTGCGHSSEENAVLPVQKFVGLKDRLWHHGRRNGDGLSGSGRGLRCWPLRQRGCAERKDKKCCDFG